MNEVKYWANIAVDFNESSPRLGDHLGQMEGKKMDMWAASKEQIKKAAEIKFGVKVLDVYVPSGLYAWVTLENKCIKNIYERDLVVCE